jgi:hypothetical protein
MTGWEPRQRGAVSLMMSGKEGLIYTARLALRCAVAIVVVTVLFLLVAGFLAYPIAPITTLAAFVGGVWGPREWLHLLPI